MPQYEEAVKLWQSWNIQTEADLSLRLDSFRILFAYHSGKIENDEINYHDTREIFENGTVINYTGSTRTLFEQQNQKTCYELLQSKILAQEPGAFKKHDYVTGKNEVGSPPEAVADDLTELIEEVNAIGAQAPLKAGAYFHARFENIHPFADGNGRVGRTLLNYWLMINHYPPLVIYEEDRRAYYDALQTYDEQEDLVPLVTFLEDQTVKTWSRFLKPPAGNAPPRKGLNFFMN